MFIRPENMTLEKFDMVRFAAADFGLIFKSLSLNAWQERGHEAFKLACLKLSHTSGVMSESSKVRFQHLKLSDIRVLKV